MTIPWGFSTLWHRLAVTHPDRIAFIHGDRILTWDNFDQHAAALAAAMKAAGIGTNDVVALCLHNSPDYLVSFAAALRIGATPANVNYRYRGPELDELLTVLDPRAIVVSNSVLRELAHFTGLFHRVRLRISVGEVPAVPWAVPIQELTGRRQAAPSPSPQTDATIIKCTGGTTGRPAAVRWSASDMFQHLNHSNPWVRHDTTTNLAHTTPATGDVRLVAVPPLVHGTALTRALGALCAGGTVITLRDHGFNPAAALDAIADNSADTLAIVGDVHARPILQQLRDHPHRWRLDSLRVITSSGAAWTAPVKTELLALLPHLELVETLGATEATGLGRSIARHDDIPDTGVFLLGEHAAILRPDGTLATAGETGQIAVSRPHPIGLHPDAPLPPERFLCNGQRPYLLSGDHAQLLDSGRFKFLGRDDDCINTGGEKVYAPEVAHILAEHPAVADVAVFGTPDPRFGAAVAALIATHQPTDLDDILDHARRHLAGFKVPTRCRLVDHIPRTNAGKIDLSSVRELITA